MASDPLKYFRVEARELLEGLSQGILLLEKGRAGSDVGPRLLRFAHTLKGAARVVRQPAIAELAHRLEDQVGPHRDCLVDVTREQLATWLSLVDEMGRLVSLLGDPGSSSTPPPRAEERSERGGPAEVPCPPGASPGAERAAPAVAPSPGEAALVIPRLPEGQDEIRETVRVDLGELQVMMDGLSTLGFQAAAFHRDLEAIRNCRRLATALLQAVGQPSTARDAGEGAKPRKGGASQEADDRARSRVVMEELAQALDRAVPALGARLDRWERDLGAVRQRADRLRLVPCREIFPSLERAARDAAQELHRRIDFVASGGENRMEGHALWAMRAALLHVIRNSVAHGIEDEAQRRSLGKPAAGTVRLEVKPLAGAISFACSDDGRGIDLTAVRGAAARRGLVEGAAAKALSLQEAMELLMRGGVTTARQVTEVAGRGVGLDVVRETLQRLKGEVRVESRPGQGTRMEMRVPLCLSSLDVLSVESGGHVVSVPLASVRHVLRVGPGDLVRSSTGGSIVDGDEVIPFLPLSRLLPEGTPGNLGSDGRGARTAWPVMVLTSDAGLAALGVDRVRGTSLAVVHSLPALAGECPAVGGATLDHEGTPRLVLDPQAVVAAVLGGRTALEEPPAREMPRILVVDDSLTTRMLEQSILESAGYEVDLATCGEEGLEKARRGDYRLILVDVEMPGMNGFEFLRHCGEDPVLREIPAILVSSRNSPDDLRRGTEVGARAYIVKGEFDQGHFLQTIRRLLR